MAGRFDGKIALITGAASGIGRATALKLASQGAILALCDINPQGLRLCLEEIALMDLRNQRQQQQLTQEDGSLETPGGWAGPGDSSEDLGVAAWINACHHATYTCDVASSADVEETVHAVFSRYGRSVHLVFNCAGVNPTALDIADTTDAYFDKLVNTNLRGPYNVTRAVAPFLEKGDAIVNVASVAGLRASRGFSIYCATKFGVIGFTKAMALELGPRGIRINCVCPGPTDTPTMAGNVAGGDENDRLVAGIALGRLGQPEEIADVVAFLFSDESRYMNGSVVEISGGQG